MFSKLLTSILLVAGAAIASSAGAADINRSTPLVLNASGTGSYGDSFTANLTGKTFIDDFTFNIANAADFSGSVISIRGTSADLNITGFSLIPSVGTAINGFALSNGALDAWALLAPNIVSGLYKLQVSGTVIGAGGSFGGNVNISPVPEPATWGMMVAGLGLMGVAMSRRKKREISFAA